MNILLSASPTPLPCSLRHTLFITEFQDLASPSRRNVSAFLGIFGHTQDSYSHVREDDDCAIIFIWRLSVVTSGECGYPSDRGWACAGEFHMATSRGPRVLRYLVNYYSGCVSEGVLDEINI